MIYLTFKVFLIKIRQLNKYLQRAGVMQKIIGFFNSTLTNSTLSSIVVTNVDRQLVHHLRTPIGTTLDVEQTRLESQIAEQGGEFVKTQLLKEAAILQELNMKIDEINKKSESCLASILNDDGKKSTMKEKLKAAYDSIKRQGLDLESNRDLYETQGTLVRRQMVLKEHPDLLDLDYNQNVAHTNQ